MRFDLVRAPWIPCLTLDGREVELGLLDLLIRAHELREIVDASPIVVAALYRVIEAIVYRATAPEPDFDHWPDPAAWARLLAQKRFDADRAGRYFARWPHRFDLFDSERPFYQTTDVADCRRSPITRLSPALSSGNNATLFDHSFDDVPRPVAPASAARLVVAAQVFALAAGQGRPFHSEDSPAARAMTVLLAGESLFETLVLNLVPPVWTTFRTLGLPAWERATERAPDHLDPEGLLDYLTWPARRIRLDPEGGAGNIRVRWVRYAQGLATPPDFPGRHFDPYARYRRREKPEPDQAPWMALRLSPERALWRDSAALMQLSSNVLDEPRGNLEWLSWATRHGLRDGNRRARLLVFGWATGRFAKVLLWRQEQLPLRVEYLTRPELVERLQVHLSEADRARWALESRCENLATALLRSRGKSAPEPRAMVQSWGAVGAFWGALEAPFQHLVTSLPEHPEAAGKEWRETVVRLAQDAWRRASAHATITADGWQAVAKAEWAFPTYLRRVVHLEAEPTAERTA